MKGGGGMGERGHREMGKWREIGWEVGGGGAYDYVRFDLSGDDGVAGYSIAG